MEKRNLDIPFFPLGVTLLPEEIIPLRIFEPRYIQLINDCEEENLTFGIPYLKNSRMQDYGSEVRLVEILRRNTNGEMAITIEGISNFKVLDFKQSYNSKLYSGGRIRPLPVAHYIGNDEILALVNELHIKLRNKYPIQLDSDKINILELANSLNLNHEEKFKLLSLDDPQLKQEFILKQLGFYKLLKKQEEKLQNNFSLN